MGERERQKERKNERVEEIGRWDGDVNFVKAKVIPHRECGSSKLVTPI